MRNQDRDRHRTRRKRLPQLETLESWTLQSGLMATPADLAPRAAQAGMVRAQAGRLVLAGATSGVASFQRTNPEIGLSYSFGTFGALAGLGNAVASGTFQAVGFVAQGQATGSLTIYTHRGSVTLALIGPTQPGFSTLPPTFVYSITSGTGRLAGSTGTGTVSVSFRPAPAPPNARLNSGTGRMVLRFQSFPGARA